MSDRLASVEGKHSWPEPQYLDNRSRMDSMRIGGRERRDLQLESGPLGGYDSSSTLGKLRPCPESDLECRSDVSVVR